MSSGSEDGGTELARNRDGVLGVVEELSIGVASGDEAPVHDLADSVEEFEEEDGVTKRLVLEVLHLACLSARRDRIVGPLNHGLLRDLRAASDLLEDSENVVAHKLPDDSEGQGLLAISDVDSTDADKGELHVLAEVDDIVGVLNGLDAHHGDGLVDPLPINATRLDLVNHTEEDKTVLEIVVEVVDEGIDAERVDPELEGALLASALRIEERSIEAGLLLLGEGVETRQSVEQVSNEGEVELGVTSNNVPGLNELVAVNFLGIGKDVLSALDRVSLLEGSLVALIGRELVKNESVALGVLNVATEVLDTSVCARLGEVVVEPAEKDLLGRELHEVLHGLALLQEAVELRVGREGDVGQKTNANDLPN